VHSLDPVSSRSLGVSRLAKNSRAKRFIGKLPQEASVKLICVLAIATVLPGCASYDAAPAVSPQRPHTESCKATSSEEIAGLFDRWNQSLQTGDPHQVVANYAEQSILLATVSSKPRVTAAEKQDYFEQFLEDRPSGKIDFRSIELGCNSAVDAGLYTFTFAKTGNVVHARYTFTYR
jgi:hypothetical protein